MSHRSVSVVAVAAVISSWCLYGAFAQAPPEIPRPQGGAIVMEPPPIRLEHDLPGRYQFAPLTNSSVIVLDTHTGQCWEKSRNQAAWRDWGSPVKQK